MFSEVYTYSYEFLKGCFHSCGMLIIQKSPKEACISMYFNFIIFIALSRVTLLQFYNVYSETDEYNFLLSHKCVQIDRIF